jgi:hypothetical protein
MRLGKSSERPKMCNRKAGQQMFGFAKLDSNISSAFRCCVPRTN